MLRRLLSWKKLWLWQMGNGKEEIYRKTWFYWLDLTLFSDYCALMSLVENKFCQSHTSYSFLWLSRDIRQSDSPTLIPFLSPLFFFFQSPGLYLSFSFLSLTLPPYCQYGLELWGASFLLAPMDLWYTLFLEISGQVATLPANHILAVHITCSCLFQTFCLTNKTISVRSPESRWHMHPIGVR